jgi:hypothetical protein
VQLATVQAPDIQQVADEPVQALRLVVRQRREAAAAVQIALLLDQLEVSRKWGQGGAQLIAGEG